MERKMIEAKHGPHKITYNEDANLWECKAMRCSAPSLAALRTKLNNEDREDRRIDSIRAFSMDRGYEADRTDVIITMIDTGSYGVNGFRVGSNSAKREYFSLGSLVLINDRNAPKIERFKKASAAHEAADVELQAAREALPHPTAEELKKLSAAQKPKAA